MAICPFAWHKVSKDEIGRLAHAFNEMATGLQEREWLKDMFGRFVSQEVAAAIRDGQVVLEGESRIVSVLFCDIREFTDFSERHSPQEVSDCLISSPLVQPRKDIRHGRQIWRGQHIDHLWRALRSERQFIQGRITALEIRTAVRK
jgi:hypothetical protein